jgi:hypothetical protein
MIYKTTSPIPRHLRVTFELPASLWASQVSVVGDFNEWSQSATPMTQARDGAWRATIDLPSGRCYEFRYRVDGQWRMDAQADQCALHRGRTDLCLVIGTLAGECPLRTNRATQDRQTAQRSVTEISDGDQ